MSVVEKTNLVLKGNIQMKNLQEMSREQLRGTRAELMDKGLRTGYDDRLIDQIEAELDRRAKWEAEQEMQALDEQIGAQDCSFCPGPESQYKIAEGYSVKGVPSCKYCAIAAEMDQEQDPDGLDKEGQQAENVIEPVEYCECGLPFGEGEHICSTEEPEYDYEPDEYLFREDHPNLPRWPATGRDKDRYFGNTINPIQWNWW